jgi:formate hydrogenlyase subunit 4
MNVVLSLLIELLHISLMLVAAPLLTGMIDWLRARMIGRAGPSILAPGRELIRLFRKHAVTQDNVSIITRSAPVMAVGIVLAAIAMVPSFAIGMALGPLADLLVIVTLLMAQRVIVALAVFDAGDAGAGLAAERVVSLSVLTDAAMIVAVVALGLMANGFNIDQIVAQQHESLLLPVGASAVALSALLTIFLAQAAVGGDDGEAVFNGPDLALIRFSGWLRRLLSINLLSALFLPIGMASADSGPLGWLIGLSAWGLKLFLFLFGFAAVQTAFGRISRQTLPDLIGVAAVLALLAVIIVLATASAV